MVAKLVAEEGIQKGLVLSLDEGSEWVIGRDPDACQLLIEDPSASRKHLICRKTSDGIFVQNLSSTNPVSINDEEIHEPKLLHNGDLVKIGAGLYRFYSEDEAQIDQGEISQELEGDGDESPNGHSLPHEALEMEISSPKKKVEPENAENLTPQASSREDQEIIPDHVPAEEQDILPDHLPESEIRVEPENAENLTPQASSREDQEIIPDHVPAEEQDILPDHLPEMETRQDIKEQEKQPQTHLEDEIEHPPQETPAESIETPDEPKIEQEQSLMKQELEIPLEEKAEQKDPETSDHPSSSEQKVSDEAKSLENRPEERSEEIKTEPENDEEETGFDAEHISIFEEPAERSIFPEINFDLTETGRWLLKVVGGPNHGAEFTMQPASTYIIGTDPNTCDIVFHDNSVSRQHAKITLNDDDTITLEDLKSRNGTFLDGKPVTGKLTIPTNTLVMMGTSSFVVYDREGEMQTIISPLLPSIVKVLQEEPKKEEPAPEIPEIVQETPPPQVIEQAPILEEIPKKKMQAHDALGAFILIAIITGLFVIIGIGTTTLFKSQPVVTQQVIHPDRDLTQALEPFPNVKFSFNRATGRLLLVGHVLTASDKNQLLYNLQGLNYIRSIDDSGVIIDEGVWREINQVISQNPNWKGISIHSPTPGRFVISGYLKTRKQSEQLWEYISTNFPYLDLLEKRIIVEEDVVAAIGAELQNQGFKGISVQMNEGEVTLSGSVSSGKMPDFEKALAKIKGISGVRGLKNFVAELAPEQSMVNISDQYQITGVSHQGSVNTSVIINGRILTRGDVLDGMIITSIKPNAVFLEKDGIKYRIDYSP